MPHHDGLPLVFQFPEEDIQSETGGVRADRCAGSPGGEPFDQALQPTFVPIAPTFNVAGAAV